MITFLKKYWEQLLFTISLAFIVYLCGIITGYYKIFPSMVVISAKSVFEDFEKWDKLFNHSMNLKPKMGIEKTKQKQGGVIKYTPEKTKDGVILVVGMQKEYFGIKLIDQKGNILHTWNLPFTEIWPDQTHLDKKLRNRDLSITSAVLYPNGDVIFSHNRAGIARADKNSKIIWKKPYRVHHLIYKDNEGNLWAPAEIKGNAEYQFDKKKLIINNPEYILKISPQGELLEKIDLVKSIIKSGRKGFFGQYIDRYKNESSPIKITGEDFTHLNTVKPVEIPEFYNLPVFDKGDIIASLRNVNSIIAIDHKSHTVKWAMSNQFVHQHDPDFLSTGEFSVFDNRGGGKEGLIELKSRIVTFDPMTQKMNIVYEKDKSDAFYTEIRGNHQPLSNGNNLIVESHKGHIFEIDKDGKIVWDYFDKWDKNYVSIITYAKKYPISYAKFTEE